MIQSRTFSALWPQFCKQFSVSTFPIRATCTAHIILLGWSANITHVFTTQFYPLSSHSRSRPNVLAFLFSDTMRLPLLTPILNKWQNHNSHLINNHQSKFQCIATPLYSTQLQIVLQLLTITTKHGLCMSKTSSRTEHTSSTIDGICTLYTQVISDRDQF